MIDVACSLGLVAIFGALVAAYAVRVVSSGAASFDRVKRDRGSLLFGASAMQMGYWALNPIGRMLASLGVSANFISTSSLVLGLGAALAITFGHYGVAAAFAVVSALCDALDGMVARHTKTASDSGEVLDATVDRYVEFAFLGGLAIHEHESPVWLGMTLAAILGSFMVSYATAKGEAMGVEAPRGAMRRPERAAYLTLGALLCPFTALWVEKGGPSWAVEAPMILAVGLVAIVGNVSAVRRLASIARTLRGRRVGQVTQLRSPESPREPRSGQGGRAERGAAGSERMNVERAPKGGLLATFGRHQVGSAVATAIDFSTMSILVSGLGMSAAAATAIGAALGGFSNFLLGRHWIFSARHGEVGPQALRYAFVSGASLAWNTGGEYVLHDLVGLHYLLARVIIALVVSVFWNFPVQRAFVYRQVAAGAATPRTS